ncbi:hypothetical protein [Citricoccus sp. GCM10030269]|uniref:hypothetical protein n=1 Tax=Citricoccus sp. GCM10030269 TaxID=3273388 RepID=UPI003615406F
MPVPDAPRASTPEAARGAESAAPPVRGRRRWAPVVISVLLGAAVGILGTVLHLHVVWVGPVVLPWGSVLALLLVGSAQLWWSLRSSLAWTGGVLAIAAFTTALALGNLTGMESFSVALNEYTLEAVPGAAIAGAVWAWGIPVVAVVTMLTSHRLSTVTTAGRD